MGGLGSVCLFKEKIGLFPPTCSFSFIFPLTHALSYSCCVTAFYLIHSTPSLYTEIGILSSFWRNTIEVISCHFAFSFDFTSSLLYRARFLRSEKEVVQLIL